MLFFVLKLENMVLVKVFLFEIDSLGRSNGEGGGGLGELFFCLVLIWRNMKLGI